MADRPIVRPQPRKSPRPPAAAAALPCSAVLMGVGILAHVAVAAPAPHAGWSASAVIQGCGDFAWDTSEKDWPQGPQGESHVEKLVLPPRKIVLVDGGSATFNAFPELSIGPGEIAQSIALDNGWKGSGPADARVDIRVINQSNVRLVGTLATPDGSLDPLTRKKIELERLREVAKFHPEVRTVKFQIYRATSGNTTLETWTVQNTAEERARLERELADACRSAATPTPTPVPAPTTGPRSTPTPQPKPDPVVARLERLEVPWYDWVVTPDPRDCTVEASVADDPAQPGSAMLLRYAGGNAPRCSPHFYRTIASTHRNIWLAPEALTAHSAEMMADFWLLQAPERDTCPPRVSHFEIGFGRQHGLDVSEVVVQYESRCGADAPRLRVWAGYVGGDEDNWVPIGSPPTLEAYRRYRVRLVADFLPGGYVRYRSVTLSDMARGAVLVHREAGENGGPFGGPFKPWTIKGGAAFDQFDVLLQPGGNVRADGWDSMVADISLMLKLST